MQQVALSVAILTGVLSSAVFAGAKVPVQSCQEGVCSVHFKNMYLAYQLQGNKELKFTMSAKTSGWVAVGFGVNNTMAGAVMIMGYVDSKGKVHLSQEYGVKGNPPHKNITKLGGIAEVKLVSGQVNQGQTTISFTLPLKPKTSKYNYAFVSGESIPVILAYGKNGAKNLSSYHQYRASTIIKLPG